MPQAKRHEPWPVADAADKHAAVDQVPRLRGKGPVTLGVCDREAAILWCGLWLREGDVETEDLGVRMRCREGDGPDAAAAANVKDALVGRHGQGQGSAVEAMVLNKPHVVLQICGLGQLSLCESLQRPLIYLGGQSQPGNAISFFYLVEVKKG